MAKMVTRLLSSSRRCIWWRRPSYSSVFSAFGTTITRLTSDWAQTVCTTSRKKSVAFTKSSTGYVPMANSPKPSLKALPFSSSAKLAGEKFSIWVFALL